MVERGNGGAAASVTSASSAPNRMLIQKRVEC